jgi:hypothetical protein
MHSYSTGLSMNVEHSKNIAGNEQQALLQQAAAAMIQSRQQQLAGNKGIKIKQARMHRQSAVLHS